MRFFALLDVFINHTITAPVLASVDQVLWGIYVRRILMKDFQFDEHKNIAFDD